jgi:hypothetical protein
LAEREDDVPAKTPATDDQAAMISIPVPTPTSATSAARRAPSVSGRREPKLRTPMTTHANVAKTRPVRSKPRSST